MKYNLCNLKVVAGNKISHGFCFGNVNVLWPELDDVLCSMSSANPQVALIPTIYIYTLAMIDHLEHVS